MRERPGHEPAAAGAATAAPAAGRFDHGRFDAALAAVVMVWAMCLTGWLACLARYGSPLPWCDEYLFVDEGIATGAKPITATFLWRPSNEHRQPLLRLWGALLGRASNWDFRPLRAVNVVILAAAALAAVLAVRRARGRSDVADVFLPLLVLAPFHDQTLLIYAHANAVPFAVWCAAASLALLGWPFESVGKLLLFVALALVVTWIGGPVGNLWSLGLAALLVMGFMRRTDAAWRWCAASGISLVVGSTLLMLMNMPPPLGGGMFLSDSVPRTLLMTAKYSVAWMGNATLVSAWPWALLVPLLPAAFVAGRVVSESRQWQAHGAAEPLGRWFWVLMLAASTGLVALALGRGRGLYPQVWESRYAVFTAPIVITIYFGLVAYSAPRWYSGLLAAWMALCFMVALPPTLQAAREHRARHQVLVRELREGRRALSVLAEEMPQATGWAHAWGVGRLVEFWMPMRTHGISAFAKVHGTAADPELRCVAMHAARGDLQPGLQVVRLPQGEAVRRKCVESRPGNGAMEATYEIDVPSAGAYRLCCRWQCPAPGGEFTVQVDDAPPLSQSLEPSDRLLPHEFAPLLTMSAGMHRLRVTWPAAGARMDLLELMLQEGAPVAP